MKEDELNKLLSEMSTEQVIYNEQKHETVLREVANMYKAKTKRATYIAWASNIFFVALMLFFFLQLMQADSVKMMLFMAVMSLICYETTVVARLWWWTYSSRNATLEALKEVQLQIAELHIASKAMDSEKPNDH